MNVVGIPSESNVEPIVSGTSDLVLLVPKCGTTIASNANSTIVFVLITEETDFI